MGTRLRRLTVMVLVGVLVPVGCFASSLHEFGVHVNLDRLATANSSVGRWHASIEAYMQTDIDAVWRLNTGIGFDFATLSPSVSIGFLGSILTEMDFDCDLVLRWIPRYGIAATINTGICYHPTVSAKARWIVEITPIRWHVVSIDHSYFPIPTLDLSMTIGGVMLLSQGGFFGETITIEAYKIESRRLPFSLFIGNGWYLTAGHLTTRVGYRL